MFNKCTENCCEPSSSSSEASFVSPETHFFKVTPGNKANIKIAFGDSDMTMSNIVEAGVRSLRDGTYDRIMLCAGYMPLDTTPDYAENLKSKFLKVMEKHSLDESKLQFFYTSDLDNITKYMDTQKKLQKSFIVLDDPTNVKIHTVLNFESFSSLLYSLQVCRYTSVLAVNSNLPEYADVTKKLNKFIHYCKCYSLLIDVMHIIPSLPITLCEGDLNEIFPVGSVEKYGDADNSSLVGDIECAQYITPSQKFYANRHAARRQRMNIAAKYFAEEIPLKESKTNSSSLQTGKSGLNKKNPGYTGRFKEIKAVETEFSL